MSISKDDLQRLSERVVDNDDDCQTMVNICYLLAMLVDVMTGKEVLVDE